MSPLAVPESPSGLMPRRQSCDRCHEQKVRCFTNESQGSKVGDDCASAGLPQSGRFISPNPCSRCKRAKATCIYSPQQRSGRPRLPRDPSSLPIRKRRVSRRSSSSASRSPTSSPSSSPSLPRIGASSTPGVSKWTPNQLHRHQPFESHVSPHVSSMSTVQNEYHYHNNGAYLVQPQLTFSDWSSYETTEPPIPFCTPPVDMQSSNPFILKSNASPAEISQTRRDYYPTPDQHRALSFESQTSSTYLEQLTEINMRLYRVSQTTNSLSSCPPSSTLPFSPIINEVCNTASSLADLTGRYNSERVSHNSASAFDFNTATTSSPPTAIGSAMDASIGVMIFSCHQSLLTAFEDICHSFLVWLSEIHSQPQTAATVRAMGGMLAGPSETLAQILSMTNLLGHLLQRLEQSIRPLDLDIDPSLSMGQTQQTCTNDEHINMDGASQTAGLEIGGSFGYYDGSGEGQYDYADTTGAHGTVNTATPSIYNQMEQRQNRVKAQMRAIKRWIRKSEGIM